jgi:hypothetical protein
MNNLFFQNYLRREIACEIPYVSIGTERRNTAACLGAI